MTEPRPVHPSMFPTSLRARLLLAFLVLVALMVFVAVASLANTQRVSSQVAELRARGVIDLRAVDLARVGLEVEGYWNPNGSFVAKDTELIPAMQRPRLRGEIQAVDAESRTITLYGLPLRVPHNAESADEDGVISFESLAPGQRVEVFCTVQDGVWTARKIQQRDVKSSDKIKGTPTAFDFDGEAPETVEIEGLLIVVEPATSGGTKSVLGHLEDATHFLMTLQECRSAAHQLVLGPTEQDVRAHAATLDRIVAELQQLAKAALGGDDPRAGVELGLSRVVRTLARETKSLQERAARLRDLALRDPALAAAELEASFDPFLQEDVLPLVYAYLSEAEEDLGDELRRVLDGAASTARLALTVSAIAVVAAFVLGFLVWRSIERPIRTLRDAAMDLGRGKMDTRVELDSHDEFGVLASAFNRMAGDLARSTVSLESMERVQDRLRQSLAEKDLLLRELHHRVKNNMQVVSSLLAMQSDGGYPEVSRILQESQDRIRSIALIHEQLYRSAELARIEIKDYLESLTSHLLLSFGHTDRVRIEVDADAIALDVDQSMACGLIVNELVTNSLKHAFPEGRSGKIRVSLREEPDGERVLEVADDGPGMEGWNPARGKTLGMSLVEMLARQLRGRVDLQHGAGARMRIRFPRRAVEMVA